MIILSQFKAIKIIYMFLLLNIKYSFNNFNDGFFKKTIYFYKNKF